MKSLSNGFMVRSKTEQVLNYMKGMIESGGLRAGEQLLPEHRLAERLDVSVITVRRGLEELVRKGLIYKVQGKGSFVSESQPDAKGDSCTFNLVYPKALLAATSDPFLAPLIDGIQDCLSKRGGNLRLLPLTEGQTLSDALKDPSIRPLLGSGVIVVNHQVPEDALEALKSLGASIVSVGTQRGCPQTPCVETDHFDGGREAAKHLLSLGRRKIAFIGGKRLGQPYCLDIAEGIKEACKERGVEADEGLFAYMDEDVRDAGREAACAELALRLLDEGRSFDSALALGSEASRAVLKAFKGRGVKVPEQVALVSYTDFPPVSLSTEPALTAVGQPVRQMGFEAARMLLKLKRSGNSATCVQPPLFKTGIIVRESCGCGL